MKSVLTTSHCTLCVRVRVHNNIIHENLYEKILKDKQMTTIELRAHVIGEQKRRAYMQLYNRARALLSYANIRKNYISNVLLLLIIIIHIIIIIYLRAVILSLR